MNIEIDHVMIDKFEFRAQIHEFLCNNIIQPIKILNHVIKTNSEINNNSIIKTLYFLLKLFNVKIKKS